jgi:hypothetical protein
MSTTIQFRGGRLPHDANPPRLLFENYLRAAPTPPAAADWIRGVKKWHMLLNDQLGSCTASSAGHTAQQINWNGRDQDAPVTDDQVLAMYRAISGYTPGNKATDVGATLQDALNYWHKNGIGGNRIVAFAQVRATDLDAVRLAIARFGSVYTGMWLPQSAMDQFSAGKPWTVAPRRTANLGGHCVPVMAYDADSFACVTWGRVQPMTVPFFRAQFDECWVPIDLDWMRTNGLSPAGLDTAALNADYTALTGKPGPFPAVTPQPGPTPAPQPGPVSPGSANAGLVRAFEEWRKQVGA